jgi:hypothetical protein
MITSVHSWNVSMMTYIKSSTKVLHEGTQPPRASQVPVTAHTHTRCSRPKPPILVTHEDPDSLFQSPKKSIVFQRRAIGCTLHGKVTAPPAGATATAASSHASAAAAGLAARGGQ